MLAIDSGTIYVRMKHINETLYQKPGRQYLEHFFIRRKKENLAEHIQHTSSRLRDSKIRTMYLKPKI